MGQFFGVSVLAVLIAISNTIGQNLQARRVKATLPGPMYQMAPYYDGVSDSIYILGGVDDSNPNGMSSILRFDIYTETIENMGRLPRSISASPVAANSAGNLFYFDGHAFPPEVHEYDIINKSISIAGTLALSPYFSAAAKNSKGKVILIGGQTKQRNLLEVNIDREFVSSEIVGELSERFLVTECAQITNNTAIVFGTGGRVPYLTLDLDTLETIEVAPTGAPEFQHGMKLTHDRKFVYLFGGNFSAQGLPPNGIIQLDPVTHYWEFHAVDNFPSLPDSVLYFASEVVWVEKLNRIYMFGGGLRNSSATGFVILDDIYYIDLDPIKLTTTTPSPTTTLDPVLFSCDDRSDGTHPHPSDCSKYIACRNGTLEGVHPCSPPLLYDPILGTCNLPSLVDCDLSCENKEDGIYPHPQACDLFIICSNRELNVFWCDPPLLFDPHNLICNLPELVSCSNL